MNRFNRLAKLNRLIKEGAKKKEEIAALRNILMSKYDRSASGLAEPYWNKFIQSRDLNQPVLTEADLPVALPPTKEELIDLLKGSENTYVINKLKSAYPEIDFDQFSSEYLKWLYSRYISREKKEVHPIEDSISTLLQFREFQDRYKNDASFREEVAQARLGDISSIEGLTIDHMEKVISLRSDLTVRVHGVDISDKEFLGKFGDWNLWLPHTKETSVKIAGYDEDTYEPKTTWCTARTKGSNLFYNYIGRDDVPSFLFYIIRDNPENDDDWLSLGYVSQGTKLAPDFSGQRGGLSVNRANEGLKQEDYSRILGDQWDSIRSRIEREIEDFKKEDGTYESPARSIILELAKNVSKFKREWYPKSTEEKKDFAKVILNSEPSKEVRGEIYKFYAEKDPHNFLTNYMDKAKEIGLNQLMKSAFKSLAEKDPNYFLSFYMDEAKAEGLDHLIKSALERLAEEDPLVFLSYYMYEAKSYRLDNLIKSALESLVEKDPWYFFANYMEAAKEFGLDDLMKSAFESLAEKDPRYFLTNYMAAAKELELDDLIKSVFESLAEKDPQYFILSYMAAAKEFGLDDLVKSTLESIAEENPRDFLSDFYYLSVAETEGLDHVIKSALERVAEKDPQIILYNNILLDYAKEFGLDDLIKSAFESLAEKDSRYFLSFYMEKAKAEGLDHLIKTTIEKLSDVNLRERYKDDAKRIGINIDTEPLEGEVTTASMENKLLKLSRALNSLGLMSQASRIRRLTL